MFVYDKKLIYPVKIKNPNPKLAQLVMSQFGGPHGELGAAERYLSQRYAVPYGEIVGILTDIGTEELSHVEMVCAIIYQLTKNIPEKEIMDSGFAQYFVDHTTGLYPQSAAGVPYTAKYIASTGDLIADLSEDLGAEQKARLTYDNILRFADDPDLKDAIRFLRAREVVHYQRFGDTNLTDLSGFLMINKGILAYT